jgi:hypothetical protein
VAHQIKVATGYSPETPLVLTTGGQLVTDRYGMSTARAVWWYYGPSPEDQVGMLSAHPRWSFLDMDKRTISLAEDGHWDIVGDYFGVQGIPEAIYTLDNSTSQEPIETHKDFATFAGYEASPLNGARFDHETGEFINFVRNPAGTNTKWVGVRAYLNASAVWRQTTVRKIRPSGADLDNVGKIDSPPNNPPTPSGRNWLYGACSYDQKGRTFTIRREWLLSGPRGWNDVIYAS